MIPVTAERVNLLRQVELFEGLTESELADIAGLMRRRPYRRGMLIFLESEPVDAVHFIEDGSVKVFVAGPDGQERILNVLGPGDFFPHVGFLDGGPAPGTAQALEDTAVWLIERREFYRLLTQHPPLAVRMVAVLSERIRRLQLQLHDLGTYSVPARLARTLVRLSRIHGIPADPGQPGAAPVRIPLQLSQYDLASMAGTTRETVSRVLAAFRREGILSVDRGHLIVHDPARLQEWC